MKQITAALLLISAVLAPAQTLNPTLSVLAVPPGSTTTLSVVFTDSATPSNTVALEWGVSLPVGIQTGPWTNTIGANAAQTLNCQGLLCLEYNQTVVTPIVNGPVASIPLTVGPNVTPGSYPITLTALLSAVTSGPLTDALSAVDSSGNAVSITSTPINLIVLSKYDLNSDGVVNSLDIQIALSQALKQTPCTNGDVDGNGKCQIKDVQLVILASLGKIPL